MIEFMVSILPEITIQLGFFAFLIQSGVVCLLILVHFPALLFDSPIQIIGKCFVTLVYRTFPFGL